MSNNNNNKVPPAKTNKSSNSISISHPINNKTQHDDKSQRKLTTAEERRLEVIKAEARAYALGLTTKNNNNKNKNYNYNYRKQQQQPSKRINYNSSKKNKNYNNNNNNNIAYQQQKSQKLPPSSSTTIAKGTWQQQQQQWSSTTAAAAATTTTAAAIQSPQPSVLPNIEQQQQQQVPVMTTQEDDDEYDIDDDDYAKFVKVLALDDDSCIQRLLDDDEDEFQLDNDDEDDDEDDDDDDDDDEADNEQENNNNSSGLEWKEFSSPTAAFDLVNSPTTATTLGEPLEESATTFYKELEEELGWLEEEDMEAAVATLLDPSSNGCENNLAPIPEQQQQQDFTLSNNTETTAATRTAMTPMKQEYSTNTTTTTTTPSTIAKDVTPSDDTVENDYDAAAAENIQQQPIIPPEQNNNNAARMLYAPVTEQQQDKLRHLLEKHYQLLLQQAVLAVRAANNNNNSNKIRKAHAYAASLVASPDSSNSNNNNNNKTQEAITAITSVAAETADELVDILDSAVGMLQDLNQKRRDALRNHILFQNTTSTKTTPSTSPKRALFNTLTSNLDNDNHNNNDNNNTALAVRRLTRAQFTKTLLESELYNQKATSLNTVFNIPGLYKLESTLHMIDNSVNGTIQNQDNNILELDTNAKACRVVLQQSGASCQRDLIPGSKDLSKNFSDGKELFGFDFRPPCNPIHESILRRNRNLFTAGEDNLVLRGVNLYGEKQWMLISDRFLPERSFNIISQRYSKLCYLLYKANGIYIDPKGCLATPPKLESVDDLDEKELSRLQPVKPPAILNVHRWSIEEDITLLKAVPLMGSMWAELRARLIPHRDRGHLRKRYQVLERRVKATHTRNAKYERTINIKLGKPVQDPQHTDRRVIPIIYHSPGRMNVTGPSQNPIIAKAAIQTPPVHRTVVMKTKQQPKTDKGDKTKAVATTKTDVKKGKKTLVKQSATTQKVQPQHVTKPADQGKASIPASPQHHHPPVPPYPHHPIPHPHMAYYYHPYMYPPHMYYPHHYPGYGHDESSRAAFEKLVTEGGNEWPPNSQMKKMIEKDTESMVASTIITQLAKSPTKAAKAAGKSTSTSATSGKGENKLEKVDNKVGKGQKTVVEKVENKVEKGENKVGKDENKVGKGENKVRKAENKVGKGESKVRKGESKVGKGGNELGKGKNKVGKHEGKKDVSNGVPSENDSSDSISFLAGVLERSNQYKEAKKQKASKNHPSNAKASPSQKTKTSSFESPSKTKAPTAKETPQHTSILHLPHTPATVSSPTVRPPGFSPLESVTDGTSPFMYKHSELSMNSYGLNGYDLSNTFAIPGAEGEERTGKDSSAATPHKALFGEGATLMENDLEAISALNSLSHSPAKSLLAVESTKDENQGKTQSKKRKSLFSVVVGNTNSKKENKKAKKSKSNMESETFYI